MGRLPILVVLFATTACGAAGTTSRADSCRTGVILGNIAGKKSSAELSLENMRCDNIEANERENERAERQLKLAADRERAQDKAMEQAAAAQKSRMVALENAQQSEALAQIRRDPSAPEVGGTPEEAKLICKRQHGQYQEPDDNVGCLVGGQRIFACHVVNETLQRCDTYIEDADIVVFRTEFEKRLCPAKQEVHGGVRVFAWETGHLVVTIKMFERGVRVGHEYRLGEKP